MNTDDFLCQYLLFRFALSPTRENIFDEISYFLEFFDWINQLINIYWRFDKYLVPAVTAESQKVKQCLQARHYAIPLKYLVLHLLFRTYICKYQIAINCHILNIINSTFYHQIINVDSTKRLLQIWRQLGQWRHSQHPEIQLCVHAGHHSSSTGWWTMLVSKR